MDRRVFIAAILVVLAGSSPARAEPRVIFERSRVLSGTSTVMQIARQFEATRVVPRVVCTENVPIQECFGKLDFTHTTETNFKQLYEVTVLKRTFGVSVDGAPYVDVETVQRELFATDLGPEVEGVLEERLLTYVKKLHPQAAAFPFAARITGRDPLPFSFMYDASATPTWICVERGDARDVAYLLPLPEIGGYTVGNAPDEVKDTVCDALQMTVASEDKDRYETGIGVNTLATFGLTLQESWDPGSADSRAFHPRPATYTKRTLEQDEEPPRLGYFQQDGQVIASTLSEDRVYRAAVAEPLAIDLPRRESAIWLTRFKGEERKIVYGSDASDELVSSWEVLAAWLPLTEPEATGERPHPPPAGWLRRVQRELEISNEVSSAPWRSPPRIATDWSFSVRPTPRATPSPRSPSRGKSRTASIFATRSSIWPATV